MTTTTRRKAEEELEDLRARVAQWRQESVESLERLRQLEEAEGGALLDAPDKREEISGAVRDARLQWESAERAVAASGERLDAAERKVWAAVGREWAAEVKQRRKLLDAHQARTAELLAPLVAHAGVDYEPVHGGGTGFDLSEDLEVAEAQLRVCEDVAAGRDPRSWLTGLFVNAPEGRVHGLRVEEYFVAGEPPRPGPRDPKDAASAA